MRVEDSFVIALLIPEKDRASFLDTDLVRLPADLDSWPLIQSFFPAGVGASAALVDFKQGRKHDLPGFNRMLSLKARSVQLFVPGN